jgi:hypothetical protein
MMVNTYLRADSKELPEVANYYCLEGKTDIGRPEKRWSEKCFILIT